MRVRTGTRYTSIKRFPDVHSIPPIIVVSTKHDLKAERNVTPQEGKALARDLGCGLVDISTKLNAKTDAPFHDIVRASRERRDRRMPSGWGNCLTRAVKNRNCRLKP